ncbi:CPBP family intramembrane glutamic endopeptidase [Sabulibacter ruber]|uniref:CPBP family intramembrane glutamic endopeptidase n=1 Tax=Sabulibacter ruber TaxID=2811901 RepID=UPI001A971F51|nr:CPBP family intramembrane glutamic endopeptidase [Sabulibacter ruber]
MLKALRETGGDLLGFLRNPREEPSPVQTGSLKAKRLFSLLAIDYGAMFLVQSLKELAQWLGLVAYEDHNLDDTLKEWSAGAVILSLMVVMPFIEELIFRLGLRFERNALVQFALLLSKAAGKLGRAKTEVFLREGWRRFYPLVFYLLAALFALVHISRYEGEEGLWPILVLPQFISGLLMGYLRVRHGFNMGFLLHAIRNAILLIPLLIGIHLFDMETEPKGPPRNKERGTDIRKDSTSSLGRIQGQRSKGEGFQRQMVCNPFWRHLNTNTLASMSVGELV